MVLEDEEEGEEFIINNIDRLQDVARSGFADMLNDIERNKAYEMAIEVSVTTMVRSASYNPLGDRHFKCCDIGTGSGLLSMLIVRAFKKLDYTNFHVYAYEAFKPIARCAEKIIKINKMSEHITVIPYRSDLSRESPGYDLLVAELLDTELIGEGCLEIYRHAVENLCSPDCIFVPHKARIYVEPLASSLLFARHAFDDRIDLQQGSIELDVPQEARDCCGVPALDDMQLSALKPDRDFQHVSKPQVVFEFEFNKLSGLKLHETKELEFSIETKPNQPIVLAMWWDITMYDESKVNTSYLQAPFDPLITKILSCAPTWARDEDLKRRDQKFKEKYGSSVWREHWMQAIYYFGDVVGTRKLVELEQGDKLKIYARHDTYSMWFDIKHLESSIPPACYCGYHRFLSRSQQAFISNQSITLKRLLECKFKNVNLFPIVGKVFLTHSHQSVRSIWHLEFYTQKDCNEILGSLHQKDIPCQALTDSIAVPPNVDSMMRSRIMCTPVYFDDLSRIRIEVERYDGFEFSQLDNLLSNASLCVDTNLEPHPLWEYVSRRRGSDFEVNLEHLRNCTSYNKRKEYRISMKGSPEDAKRMALVFWFEYTSPELKKSETRKLTSGYIEDQDGLLEWNRDCKQLVHFLNKSSYTTQSDTELEFSIIIRTIQRKHGNRLCIQSKE